MCSFVSIDIQFADWWYIISVSIPGRCYRVLQPDQWFACHKLLRTIFCTGITNTIISSSHVFFSAVLHFNWQKVLSNKTITWSSIFFFSVLCCRIFSFLAIFFPVWFFFSHLSTALRNCLFANVLSTYTLNTYFSFVQFMWNNRKFLLSPQALLSTNSAMP